MKCTQMYSKKIHGHMLIWGHMSESPQCYYLCVSRLFVFHFLAEEIFCNIAVHCLHPHNVPSKKLILSVPMGTCRLQFTMSCRGY